MNRNLLCGAVLFSVAVQAVAGTLPDGISQDGFESGNTLGWSLTTPALPTPSVFRLDSLALRDPHVFTSIPGFPAFGCLDFTDNGFPFGLAPSFNAQLATAITTDDDGDGFLDLSRLLAFRSLDFVAVAGRLDDGDGACPPPVAGTVCDWRRPPVPVTVAYDGMEFANCLASVAGTTGGYNPAVPTVIPPCFVAGPRTLTLDFNGVPIALTDAQDAARFVAGPPVALGGGLMRGFLSETAADAILIPATIPVVGGRPLSSLLKGGVGSCATGDDRDTDLGQSGWWFYFEWTAPTVSFVGQ